MTRLILSLAIAAALAATACTGARAVQASTAEAPASGLDLGMIDAGSLSGDARVTSGSGAGVPINELAWAADPAVKACTVAYVTIDACITP